MTETKKKTICVDFDGVIHSYVSGWKGVDVIPDDPVPGAIRWLWEMSEQFKVSIFSSRSSNLAGNRMMRTAIEVWALAELSTQQAHSLMDRLQFPTEKPPAVLYVDDRGFQFRGEFPTVEYINNFLPWPKQHDDLRRAVSDLAVELVERNIGLTQKGEYVAAGAVVTIANKLTTILEKFPQSNE